MTKKWEIWANVVSISASIKIFFHKKQSYKKYFEQMDENTAKNCHLYAPIFQT